MHIKQITKGAFFVFNKVLRYTDSDGNLVLTKQIDDLFNLIELTILLTLSRSLPNDFIM